MTQPVLQHQSIAPAKPLFIAFELSLKKWNLVFTSDGRHFREKTVEGGDVSEVLVQLERARARLGVDPQAPVFSCYEAGRDGFWLHRELVKASICNAVVDPSSILVNRRARRAKTDRIDGRSLAQILVRRWILKDESEWRQVRVPTVEEEDERRLQREVERLGKERVAHLSRIRSLFMLHGLREVERADFKDAASKLPSHSREELLREMARLELVETQLNTVRKSREAEVATGTGEVARCSRDLARFKGLAGETSSVLAREFFGWRKFKNRRQVGSCAGLSPTPYDSGTSAREQGISKAGNARVRRIAVELAWNWLRFQPESALSKWFHERFGANGKRNKRTGIVALARKLLVALWRYLDGGVLPTGAVLKSP